jgi:hypothetical protein
MDEDGHTTWMRRALMKEIITHSLQYMFHVRDSALHLIVRGLYISSVDDERRYLRKISE